MRVKPPGESAVPVAVAVDGQARQERIEGPHEVGATDASAPAAAVAPGAPVDGAASIAGGGAADPVMEVARRLRSGEISAREAVELLIDDVITRQVGRAAGDRHTLAAQLKDLLRRHAETDPYLASKVRRLGNRT